MNLADATQVTIPHLLGTDLIVSVDAPADGATDVVEAIRDRAIDLGRIFAPYDPESEFCRWRRGDVRDSQVSPDLARVLAASEKFWVFSKGAFHPGGAALVQRWRRAEREGVLPELDELRDLASGLELPYTVVNGPVQRIGDCSRVDLNSIARGYVLDAAHEAGQALGVARSILVDAGGDQRHWGAGKVAVQLRSALPGDGELEKIHFSNAAISRSSLPRAGFHVAGRWYRDVIDPRTGWPHDEIVKVVALAPDSMTADVLATIVGVGHSPTGGFPGCAWLTQYADGRVERSEDWNLLARLDLTPETQEPGAENA